MAFCRTIRPRWLTIIIHHNNSMIVRILFCFFWVGLLVFNQALQAQDIVSQTDTLKVTGKERGLYGVVLTAGWGSALYQNYVGTPARWQNVSQQRSGKSVTVRAMWYPDHRLRSGIETGLTTFYTYRGMVNGEPASVQVSAIPMLVVFSMPLAWHNGREKRFFERVSITGGTGAYLIRSRFMYKGVVKSQEFSAGWLAACSYAQPIGRQFRVGLEYRWNNASATKESVSALQLQLLWRAFSW